jgi:hypothetical protein
MRQAETTAQQKYGGSLTLMRVDTGWKAMYGTPNFETEEGRQEFQRLKTYKSLYEALRDLTALA